MLGAPSDLKYYEIQYTCLFGGKVYKRKGCGKRKHQRLVFVLATYTYYTLYYCFNSTIKQGCNAGVKLVLSQDKRHLEVTYVSETHNHMMNKEIVLC